MAKTSPRTNIHETDRRGGHSAHLIVDEVHHDFHDADRDDFADPDDAERGAGSRSPRLLITGHEAQGHAGGVSEDGRERDRLPGGKAEADADREAGNLADHAAGEAVEGRLGRCGQRARAAMAVMGMSVSHGTSTAAFIQLLERSAR